MKFARSASRDQICDAGTKAAPMRRSNFKCNSHIEPYSNDAAEFGHQRKAKQNVRGIDEPHAATQHACLRISVKVQFVHDRILAKNFVNITRKKQEVWSGGELH
jgi:hypothetical protein